MVLLEFDSIEDILESYCQRFNVNMTNALQEIKDELSEVVINVTNIDFSGE